MTTATLVSGVTVRLSGASARPLERVDVACVDPRTGARVAMLAGGGAADAWATVQVASEAVPGWAATSSADRAAVLRRLADLLAGAVADELATLTTLETGKRLAESHAEIGLARSYLHFYADAAEQLGSEEQRVRNGFVHHVHHQPVGVVAAVCPWNFRVSIPARKIAPALGADCPVLLKPSEVQVGDVPHLVGLLAPTPCRVRSLMSGTEYLDPNEGLEVARAAYVVAGAPDALECQE